MIRVYLEDYFNIESMDRNLPLHLRDASPGKLEILRQWLANLQEGSWHWGATKMSPLYYRCIYFEDHNDATAFCLAFNITRTVHER